MATTKAGYPGAEEWSSKDGEMNMGVCIEGVFLKGVSLQLVPKS